MLAEGGGGGGGLAEEPLVMAEEAETSNLGLLPLLFLWSAAAAAAVFRDEEKKLPTSAPLIFDIARRQETEERRPCGVYILKLLWEFLSISAASDLFSPCR